MVRHVPFIMHRLPRLRPSAIHDSPSRAAEPSKIRDLNFTVTGVPIERRFAPSSAVFGPLAPETCASSCPPPGCEVIPRLEPYRLQFPIEVSGLIRLLSGLASLCRNTTMLWGWNATTKSPPSRPIDTCRRLGKRALPDVAAISTDICRPHSTDQPEERSSGGRKAASSLAPYTNICSQA